MAEVEHVDEILKRLASPPEQKQTNTTFGSNAASSSEVPIEPRTIVELTHLALNRFVDEASAPLVIAGGGNISQTPPIPIATGADADLTALVRIQEERIRNLTNLNENAIRITETTTASIRNEEKVFEHGSRQKFEHWRNRDRSGTRGPKNSWRKKDLKWQREDSQLNRSGMILLKDSLRNPDPDLSCKQTYHPPKEQSLRGKCYPIHDQQSTKTLIRV